MKRLESKKPLVKFKRLRASIRKKFTDQEIINEIKKVRKAL